MKELKAVVRNDTEVSAIICDKCGKRITPEDWIEWNEVFRYTGCGGYGSLFGDTAHFELDLCEECWHGLVGGLVHYTNTEFKPAKVETRSDIFAMTDVSERASSVLSKFEILCMDPKVPVGFFDFESFLNTGKNYKVSITITELECQDDCDT